MMIYRRDRYGRGGDHIPFLENGYAAVRFTETHEDYTHQHQSVKIVDGKQYGDLPEFVDFGYVANAARINLITLANLAFAPAKPKGVTMLTGGLTNDTSLKWDANTDADLAGYEIVWRDTTAPLWTDSKFVGNVTNYTFKEMSKDNYFFGVRAVDKPVIRVRWFIPGRVGKWLPGRFWKNISRTTFECLLYVADIGGAGVFGPERVLLVLGQLLKDPSPSIFR